MAELVIGFGKSKSLAEDIAKKIPPPGKLRKQKAMEESDDEGGSAAAEAAFEAFAEALSSGDGKAGVKAFRLMSRLCEHGAEEVEEDEEDGEDF